MIKIGQTYGKWKVLYKTVIKGQRLTYSCECVCGKVKSIRGNKYKLSSYSCGCKNKRQLLQYDTSIKYGYWKIIGSEVTNNNGKRLIKCRCDCGLEKLVSVISLIRLDSTSCGCRNGYHHRDTGLSTNNKHKGTRFYKKFRGILQRCNNTNNKNYINYGGRGIECKYNNFREFVKCEYLNYCKSLIKYYKFIDTNYRNIHCDRTNNDGNYCKGNIRFISQKENNINTRHQSKNYISVQVHVKYKKLIPYIIRENKYGDNMLDGLIATIV